MSRAVSRVGVVLISVIFFITLCGTTPTAAATEPVSLTTVVEGDTINYHVRNVPSSGTIIVLPGTCITVLADAVRALPILAPLLIDYGSGNAIDIGTIISQILERGVLVDQDIRIANRAGEIDRSFTDVPRGVYVVVTVCGTAADIANIIGGNVNFTRDQVAISPTIVLNLGTGSGSGSGSGSSGSS